MIDMGLRGEQQWEGRNDTIAVKYHGIGRLKDNAKEKQLYAKGVLMIVCVRCCFEVIE